ncbi:MAG: thioredoxin family protein [Acidobacteriia bacterium]|nr:thioredoxin family protein [Terriglobia bacterium]
MKTIHLGWVIVPFIFWPAVLVQAGAQETGRKRTVESAASSIFQPLDRWKAAVVSGDRAALAAFYTTSPASRAKTPQGETQDPGEEPAFWSSLRAAGLSRFDLKVLEVKNLQPGVMAFVLRFEVGLQTNAGKKSGVISGAQVWVQQNGGWRILSTQRSDLAASPPMRLPEPAKPNTQLYPAPDEAPAEIAAALRASAKDRKRVILVFGGNWCYDCHVLDATFRSKQIAPLVNENYHVVHVNVGNYDKNLDLAKKYDIPLEKGVPSLAILDPHGKLLVSQKKGEFESTIRIGPEDVVEFLKRWKPQHGD